MDTPTILVRPRGIGGPNNFRWEHEARIDAKMPLRFFLTEQTWIDVRFEGGVMRIATNEAALVVKPVVENVVHVVPGSVSMR